MRLDYRGIPSKVIKGQDRKYLKVANLYKALIARAIMVIVNESFWERAETGTDSYGNEWLPLKPRTIKNKRSATYYLREWKLFRNWYKSINGWATVPSEDSGYEGQRERGQLNPAQRRRFEAAYALALGDNTTDSAKRVSLNAAWAAVKRQDPERDFVELINIRTGRLVAATYPGTVVGGRYYAPPDQKFSITPFMIDVSSVEYASEVDNVRPIFPEDMNMIILEAHEEIIAEVKALYDDMQSDYDDTRKRPKAKSKGRTDNRDKAGRNPRPPRR